MSEREAILQGRCWVYGDGIDTDILAPGHSMDLPLPEQAKYCLGAVDENFAAQVQSGDLLVAGRSFGIGSSREQAAQALIQLGIKAVVARSVARIFFRNALNLGLPVLVCPALEGVRQHDSLRIDVRTGSVENLTQGRTFVAEPLPPPLLEIWREGGLMPLLKKRLRKN